MFKTADRTCGITGEAILALGDMGKAMHCAHEKKAPATLPRS